ncbi:MAG: transporter substrate-binding domain-containing protein [Sneathiella sp.]
MSLSPSSRQWFVSSVILILMVGMALGSARSAFANKLTFLADTFPPYEFEGTNGEATGFDVEVIQAVFDHLNISVEIEFRPWKRVVATAKSGQVTGMFSCAYTAKREEFFEFSTPISYATQGVIIKKGGTSLPALLKKNLLNFRVGAVSGYASNRHLRTVKIPFIKIPLLENAFPMLLNGRFDGLFLPLEAARFIAAEKKIADQLSFLPITDIARRPYHVCFSKKWPNYQKLKEQFDRGFAVLQTSGKIAQIHSRY